MAKRLTIGKPQKGDNIKVTSVIGISINGISGIEALQQIAAHYRTTIPNLFPLSLKLADPETGQIIDQKTYKGILDFPLNDDKSSKSREDLPMYFVKYNPRGA